MAVLRSLDEIRILEVDFCLSVGDRFRFWDVGQQFLGRFYSIDLLDVCARYKSLSVVTLNLRSENENVSLILLK